MHRNILPVYGYTYGFGILVAIVSHWAENGNLMTYLENEDTTLNVVSRFHLVSIFSYTHASHKMIVMLAQRYYGWSAVSYV